MSSQTPELLKQHDENVRPWLDLIDTLRAQGVHEELDLPQIAVMGDQSSGKSSVLEAISGVPFPRGSGLVTRCPTQLTMKRTAPGTPWRATATISRSGGSRPNYGRRSDEIKEVEFPNQLTEVITELTDRVTAGKSFGFSNDAIVIHVTSPEVPDLTLIDLPGIVRTATQGQHTSVISEVNGLIESYLIQERTIILAVVPANQDVATVDILERAAAVDPTGERTIGVLTKPDLINPGSEEETAAVLRNERKPLKLGYVMVRNRTQKELGQGMSLTDARTAENDFFSAHETWSRMSKTTLGNGSLTVRLTELLVMRIKSVLPVMKFEVIEMIKDMDREFKCLGREAPTENLARLNVLMKLIADYCGLLRNTVRGDYREDLLQFEPRLRLRTLADKVFRALGDKIRDTQPDFDSNSFHSTLETEIRGLRGRELPGLINSYFFYSFMVTKLEDWRTPVDRAKQELFDVILAVSSNLISMLCPQYPGVSSLVSKVVENWVESHVGIVETRIEEHFKQEEDPFVSTNELSDEIVRVRCERFERALAFVLKSVGDEPKDKKAARNLAPMQDAVNDRLGQWYMANHGVSAAALIEDMRTVLTAYWRLSSKRLTENVCMSFEAHLLQKFAEEIESMLLTDIQTKPQELLQELFYEPAAVTEQRVALKKRKSKFDEALATINDLAPDVVAVSRRQYQDEQAAKNGSSARRVWAEADAEVTAQASIGSATPAPPVATGSSGDQRLGAKRDAGTKADEERPTGGPVKVSPTLESPPRPAEAFQDLDDGALAAFVFTGKHSDNSGYFYWLGTEGKTKKFENPHDAKRVRITSSGMTVGAESMLVSRKRGECIVGSGNDVWLCVDFGRSRVFSPDNCTLCHGSPNDGYNIVNFVFEGYDGTTWADISTNDPPRTLKSPHGVGTFPLASQGRRFRYIRIRATEPNQRGDLSLPLCAIELYGRLFRV